MNYLWERSFQVRSMVRSWWIAKFEKESPKKEASNSFTRQLELPSSFPRFQIPFFQPRISTCSIFIFRETFSLSIMNEIINRSIYQVNEFQEKESCNVNSLIHVNHSKLIWMCLFVGTFYMYVSARNRSDHRGMIPDSMSFHINHAMKLGTTSYLMRGNQVQARFSVQIWRGKAEWDIMPRIWLGPFSPNTQVWCPRVGYFNLPMICPSKTVYKHRKQCNKWLGTLAVTQCVYPMLSPLLSWR